MIPRKLSALIGTQLHKGKAIILIDARRQVRQPCSVILFMTRSVRYGSMQMT